MLKANRIRYCKMQAKSLPGNQNVISFDDIVPKATSSRRIASAAFHHCLGMFIYTPSLTYLVYYNNSLVT